MRLFTDNKGEQWRLDVTAGTLLDIKTELKLNLLDNPEEIPDSIEKMVGILWITCMEQAETRKVSPRDFAHRLGGPAILTAWDKWMEEWSDFFAHHSPARGRLIRGMWEKAKELENAKASQIEKVLSSASTDWQELLGKTQGI